MKGKLLRFRLWFFAALLVLTLASSSQAKLYYVDGERGNDSASGTRRAPWRSLERVNQGSLPPGSTVYFRAGQSYGSKQLVPDSGAQGNPVTYTSYGEGRKPEMGGVNAAGKSHVTVSKLSFKSAEATVIDLSGASHVTIDDCSIESSAPTWAPAISISGGRYNRIVNNSITQSEGKNDTINLRGNANNNLIAGNTIRISGIHCAIALEGQTGGGTAEYNIIRNNRILARNQGGALLALISDSNHNLVEGNVLSGDKSMRKHCGANDHARHQVMFKLVSRNNIVRNNVIKNYPCRDSLGLDLEAYNTNGFTNIASGNRIYNNVITGIEVGGTPLYLGENGTGGKTIDNTFKNNIIYNNGGTWYQSKRDGSWARGSQNQQMKVQVSLNVRDNLFVNNIFYKHDAARILWLNDAYHSVHQVQSWNSRHFKGNLQIDPQLHPRTQRPLPGSPVRDAGADLTVVTSPSGSGRKVRVEDPYYFSDGFGLVRGDTVRIGGQTAEIASIDYDSALLTLTRSISWRKGDPVNLPFNGKGPDIGAFEAGGGSRRGAEADLPESAGQAADREQLRAGPAPP